MLVVRNDKCGVCRNGTVDKLVVVTVGSDKLKVIVSVDELDVFTVYQKLYDVFGDFRCGLLLNNFLILCEDLIRHTKYIATFMQTFPHFVTVAGSARVKKSGNWCQGLSVSSSVNVRRMQVLLHHIITFFLAPFP